MKERFIFHMTLIFALNVIPLHIDAPIERPFMFENSDLNRREKRRLKRSIKKNIQ